MSLFLGGKMRKVTILSVLFALLLLGCSSSLKERAGVKKILEKAKTDNTEPEVSASIALPSISKQKYTVMDIFFATDRKRNIQRDSQISFGAKRGELSYGITKISVPDTHKVAELEVPSIWAFEFREDAAKHIVIKHIKRLDQSAYFKKISNHTDNATIKKAFIFIHGYNVSFENAAKRTAQMAYDLEFEGAAVFYSWPSNNNTAKYTFDEANIKWSQSNIEKFLKDFAEKSDADQIYLIAHSMGTRALSRAYISLLSKNPHLKSKFKEIILAAADIDADVFKRDIAPAMIQFDTPLTLYSSSKDKALKASKAFHGGYPRAGDSGENLIVLKGIESIDSTNLETEFVGHSYYANKKSVISDIFYLFRYGLRAEQRVGLKAYFSSAGKYWKFSEEVKSSQ